MAELVELYVISKRGVKMLLLDGKDQYIKASIKKVQIYCSTKPDDRSAASEAPTEFCVDGNCLEN